MAVKHNTAADGTFSATGATAWDEAHTVEAATITEAMQVLADNTTQDFSTAKHGYVPKGTNVGNFLKDDGSWASPSAAVAWTGITAGSGSGSTLNGDSDIVYQVAQTTASRISWRFTESAAGVSTGTPVLLQIDTLAASTAIPLLVKQRTNEVFRVPADRRQMQAADGTASVPAYSFAGDTTTGWYLTGTGGIGFATSGGAGGLYARFRAGTFEFTSISADFTGVTTPNKTLVVFTSQDIGAQIAHVSANTAGGVIQGLKARGSLTSLSALTSGDDLLTITASGYVGATNTWQEAANIKFDSTGTISDSATGIGGIIRFAVATVGGEPTEVFNVTGAQIRVISGGAEATPAITLETDPNTGLYFNNADEAIMTAGGVNSCRFASIGIYSLNTASFYANNASGSAAAPTWSYSGVGRTDDGHWSPAAGSVGLALDGREMVRWVASSGGGGWQIFDEADSDPTTTNLDSLDSGAMYFKNNKLVFAYNNGGTMTFISIPLDGLSTAWTHSTVAP